MPGQYNPILVGMGIENVTIKGFCFFCFFGEGVTSVMNCNFWLPADVCVKKVTSTALNIITKTNGHSTIKLEATSGSINNETPTSMPL